MVEKYVISLHPFIGTRLSNYTGKQNHFVIPVLNLCVSIKDRKFARKGFS